MEQALEIEMLQLIESMPFKRVSWWKNGNPEYPVNLIERKIKAGDWVLMLRDLQRQGLVEGFRYRSKYPGLGRPKSVLSYRVSEKGRELLRELAL